MKEAVAELTVRPDIGCFIHGLYLEGARWDSETGQLTESRPKELYTEMAVIWMVPVPNRKPPLSGIYMCPIYKTLTRAGEQFEERFFVTSRGVIVIYVTICFVFLPEMYCFFSHRNSLNHRALN